MAAAVAASPAEPPATADTPAAMAAAEAAAPAQPPPTAMPGALPPLPGHGPARACNKEKMDRMVGALQLDVSLEGAAAGAAEAPPPLPRAFEASPRSAHLLGPKEEGGEEALPLLLVFHGNGKTKDSVKWMCKEFGALAEKNRCLILVSAAALHTWDLYIDEHPSQDLRFVEGVLRQVVRDYRVDGARVACMGFSDGASLSLSLAACNPCLVQAAMVWAAGYCLRRKASATEGLPKPRLLIGHGTKDECFDVDRVVLPMKERLEKAGYQVEFWLEQGAAHGAVPNFAQDAISFWLALPPRPEVPRPAAEAKAA